LLFAAVLEPNPSEKQVLVYVPLLLLNE
jgi:hypothetical protein